jgi:hypothetical protein
MGGVQLGFPSTAMFLVDLKLAESKSATLSRQVSSLSASSARTVRVGGPVMIETVVPP